MLNRFIYPLSIQEVYKNKRLVILLTRLQYKLYESEGYSGIIFSLFICIAGLGGLYGYEEGSKEPFYLLFCSAISLVYFTLFQKTFSVLTNPEDVYFLASKPYASAVLLCSKVFYLAHSNYKERIAFLFLFVAYGFKLDVTYCLLGILSIYSLTFLIISVCLISILVLPARHTAYAYVVLNGFVLLLIASVITALGNNILDFWHVTSAGAVLIVTFLIVFVLIYSLRKNYSYKVLLLENIAKNRKERYSILNFVTNGKTSIGNAGSILAWKETGHSRTFLIRSIPLLLNIVIVNLIYVNNTVVSNLSGAKALFQAAVMLYIFFVPFFYVFSLYVYSDDYRAGWIFKVSPNFNRFRLRSSIFRAIYIKYCLPSQLILSAAYFFKWGKASLLHLFLWNVSLAIIAIVTFSLISRSQPFSMPYKKNLPYKNIGYIGLGLIMALLLSLTYSFFFPKIKYLLSF